MAFNVLTTARVPTPSDSKPGLDIDGIWTPYFGTEASPGTMTGWQIAPFAFVEQINTKFASQLQYEMMGMTFCHVTPSKWVANGFNGSSARATGDAKEYGPGFYSMCGQTLAKNGDCFVLGKEWFTKKQNDPRWSVLAFQVPSAVTQWLLEVAGGICRGQLLHYFTRPSGYPIGGAKPDAEDLRIISYLNNTGRVLIFPDDPELKVDVGKNREKMCAAEVQKVQGGNLPGDPWVVIGPQKPEYMTARQVAWKYPVGLWIINSSHRTLAYNNKL